MRRYESVWVVNGDLPDEEVKSAIDKSSKIISSQGGTLVGLDDWGCRKLSYKIKGTIGPPMPLIVTGDADEDRRVNTQRLLNLFEKELRQDPGQWSVLDRIWPDDVPQRTRPDDGARTTQDQAVQ